MMPTFSRDYTAKRLNRVVNHPAVLPFVAQQGQEHGLDLSPVLANLNNIALMCDDGGILALSVEPGIYEIHTQFTGELRGAAAVKLVRDMISHLFLATPAVELVTQIPVSNPAALGLVRAISGRFEFSREGAWTGLDGQPVDVDYYALRFNDWLWSEWAMRMLEPAGHAFHEELEAQLEAAGYTEPPHPHDSAHDCMVGATIGMIRAGQLDKGVILYNRWARFAGYAEIQLISRSPTVLDIRSSWLELGADGGFRIVRTQQQTAPIAKIEQSTAAAEPKPVAEPTAEPTPVASSGNPDLDALVALGRSNAQRTAEAAVAPELDPFTPWTPNAATAAVAEALGFTPAQP